MKKLILSLMISVMFLMGVSPVLATEFWDITGTYTLVFTCETGCNGDYPHTMTVDVMDLGTGVFSGTGHNSHTWTVTGTIDGDSIEGMTIDYDGSSYYVDVIGTIAQDGTMSGTWSNPSQSGTWESISGVATFVRTAEITSPGEGEAVSGLVSFGATLYDDDTDDNVQWAVRKGTCAAGTNTVFGNVDGFHDSYSWTNNVFNAVADTSTWISGDYCFIFNPTEGAGEDNIRLTREFVIVDITPPVITFELPLDGSTHSGVIDLRATCNEDCDYINFWWRAEDEVFAWYRYHYVRTDGTVFEWGLNTLDAQLANGTSYLMKDGTYYLYAAGKDLARNWARTPEIMVIVENDFDDDGILDGEDNCPYIANPNQEDIDNDGIGDVCDTCPNDAGNDVDSDGICRNVDGCPGTVADEPTKDLGTNRWIWNGTSWETKNPKGVGPQKEFSMEETQGCSCFQILDEMGDGKKTGHRKFGCSISVMEDFIASIQPPIFVDTVEVPSDGSTVSSVSLDDGVEYLLEASGTYRFANWGDYGIADAEWAYRNDAYSLPNLDGWTLGEDIYPSVLGLDVLVDSGNVYWGDYNDAHTYVSPYTGNGNPVSFDIYDSAYGDNSGFITVDIYKLP